MNLRKRLNQGADFVGALIFATMFVAFIIQVLARYVFHSPVSWTFELSLLAYVWMVFWACSTMIRWDDHISFSLVYDVAAEPVRRLLAVIGALAVAVLMILALPATLDWVEFMHVEKTSVFKFRLNWVYSIFIVFMLATIARALFRMLGLARGNWRELT